MIEKDFEDEPGMFTREEWMKMYRKAEEFSEAQAKELARTKEALGEAEKYFDLIIHEASRSQRPGGALSSEGRDAITAKKKIKEILEDK